MDHIRINFIMPKVPMLIGLAFLAFSCDIMEYKMGNGKVDSEKREVARFTQILSSGNYQISLKKGPSEQLVIVTDGNLLEHIRAEVRDGTLIIEDEVKIKSQKGIKIFVTYRELQGIRSAGASVIKSENTIAGDRLELDIPGAGLVELEVDVTHLEVTLSGAGLVHLKGRTDQQIVSLNGVGNLEAFELESRDCEVTVSGLGGAQIHVKENLVASVRGVGGIQYKGNPVSINDEIRGIGTIRKVDAKNPDKSKEVI